MKNWLVEILSAMAVILVPLIISLLLFVWHKRREQKRMFVSVMKHGLWRGSGERVGG